MSRRDTLEHEGRTYGNGDAEKAEKAEDTETTQTSSIPASEVCRRHAAKLAG